MLAHLGILIPYRDRADHLKQSAPVLKQFGSIYVIEQMDDKPFNRAKLLNAGYKEFNKEFDYFVAHDVDLIPQATGYYAHCENPTHLATMAEQFDYKMPYPGYFGGATLIPNDTFEKVNGYSNEYWAYGGEDDELRRRFAQAAIKIESRQCRFTSLPHVRDINHSMRMENLKRLKAPIDWNDGLGNCQYEIINCEDLEHYTLLQVKL